MCKLVKRTKVHCGNTKEYLFLSFTAVKLTLHFIVKSVHNQYLFCSQQTLLTIRLHEIHFSCRRVYTKQPTNQNWCRFESFSDVYICSIKSDTLTIGLFLSSSYRLHEYCTISTSYSNTILHFKIKRTTTIQNHECSHKCSPIPPHCIDRLQSRSNTYRLLCFVPTHSKCMYLTR